MKHETFDAPAAAQRLLRQTVIGSLATVEPDGHPYVSLVGIALVQDQSPLLLLSDLARHTTNIRGEPRVSLLLAGQATGDPLAGARLTIIGRIAPDDSLEARAAYLARHPTAENYAGFGDFSFWRIGVESGHLVAGFGRIVTLSLADLRGAG